MEIIGQIHAPVALPIRKEPKVLEQSKYLAIPGIRTTIP